MEAQKAYVIPRNPIDLLKGLLKDLKSSDITKFQQKVAFNQILVIIDGLDFIPVIITSKNISMEKSDSQELDEAVERVKNINVKKF